MDQTEIEVVTPMGKTLFTYKSKHIPRIDDTLTYVDKAQGPRTYVSGIVRKVEWIVNEYNNGLKTVVLYVERQ